MEPRSDLLKLGTLFAGTICFVYFPNNWYRLQTHYYRILDLVDQMRYNVAGRSVYKSPWNRNFIKEIQFGNEIQKPMSKPLH